MYFLDTNTCIYFLSGRFSSLRQKLLSHRPGEITVPALVKAELLYGALKSARPAENRSVVLQFLQPFGVAGFDERAVEPYAQIRTALERAGTPIGPNDMIIASVVMANDGILVTHNTGEFSRVTGLTIEDWAAD
jgi:tRNA(fMet)-specific endonuclease VapC